jgi:hypothetical protein
MQRHPFDPVSAALGALVVALGALVAAGRLGDADGSGGWWFAAAAAVVGLAILPWRGGGRPVGEEEELLPHVGE